MPLTTVPMPATREELEEMNLNALRALVDANIPGGVRVRSKAQALELLIPLLPPPPPRTANSVKARNADVAIRIMRDANPYRPGSDASDHFEKMKGGITVRDYLAKFQENQHRTARQWLYNAIKAGHVKTLGGDA